MSAYEDPVQARQNFIARQPMGRLAQAHEIAPLVVFLASDESAFVTGQAHAIDGGISICAALLTKLQRPIKQQVSRLHSNELLGVHGQSQGNRVAVHSGLSTARVHGANTEPANQPR